MHNGSQATIVPEQVLIGFHRIQDRRCPQDEHEVKVDHGRSDKYASPEETSDVASAPTRPPASQRPAALTRPQFSEGQREQDADVYVSMEAICDEVLQEDKGLPVGRLRTSLAATKSCGAPCLTGGGGFALQNPWQAEETRQHPLATGTTMFAHPFWGCGRFWALLACSHYINHSIEGVRAHLAPFPLSKISPADWDATHDTINSLGPGHYWIVRTQHPGYIPVPNPAAGPNDDQFVKYPAALVATHLVPSCYRPTADSDKWWYVYHPKTLISTKVFLVDPLPASNSHVAPNSDPPLKSHWPLSSSQRLPPKATAISKLRADAPPFYPSVQKTSGLRGKDACEEIALTKNGNEHSEKTAPPIATELPNFPPSSGVTGAMLSQTHTPASLAPLLSRTGSAAGPSGVKTNAEALKSSALGTARESSRNGHHPKSFHPQNISTPEVDDKPPLDQILTKTGNPHGATQNEGIPDSVSGEEVYSVTEKLKQDEAFNQAPRYDSPSAITPNEEKSVNLGTVSGAQESAHTSTLNAPEFMERIHKEAETVGCLYPVQPKDSKRTRQKGKSRYHKQPTRSQVKQTTNPQSNQDRFVQTQSLKTKVSDVSVDAITQNQTSLPLKTPPASELLDKSEGPGKDIELNKASFKTHDLNLEDAKARELI
ncbi:hypothetical protein KEM48_009329 [Puccinia striiformis f. sp. tritici PST-130]|nr:hypothetical protein KEM48_009329 [Puccinia striiformis f. sp. tritici PST-130]